MKSIVPMAAACFIAGLISCLTAFAQAAPNMDQVQNEQELIAVLQSNADWQAKQAACRGLRRIGTVDAVPALAALLTDEKLSHLARYALEPMPYPEAGKALRDALQATDGHLKAGVVTSLGARRDAEAVPLLTPLVNDPDLDIAKAAAGALGRIATPPAAKALLKSMDGATAALRPALADGLLAAGQYLTQKGQTKEATRIYRALLNADWPRHARMGAFFGLAYSEPDKTPERLVRSLRGSDSVFRDLAAQIVAETSGVQATSVYADALPSLPPAGQVALLRGLAGRKDPAAGDAVRDVLNGTKNEEVKAAAVNALGAVGSAADAAVLAAELASQDAAVSSAARESLRETKVAGMDAALGDLFANGSTSPESRTLLLAVLTDRMAPEAVPAAVKGLSDAAQPVRLAALNTLAQLGGAQQVTAIVAALPKVTDDSERAAATEALAAISKLNGEDALPVLLQGLNGADTPTRVVLLRTLGQVGGPKALDPVLAALKDSDEQISKEAARILGDWPTQDAAPHLLELAKSGDAARRDLALRGYVRLARDQQALDQKGAMLASAMSIAQTPEEKWLVLGGYGTLPTKQALDALVPLLDDASVRNEAATAIISVASELGKQNDDGKAQSITALKATVAKCDDASIRDRAQKALTTLGG